MQIFRGWLNYTEVYVLNQAKISVIYLSKKGRRNHLRILHTSDWHIGKKLKEHDRTTEFRKFFAWLADVTARENIDALIVSGDIFDSRNPSAESQEIYYSFLAEIAGKSCRHAVITSGNHDSAALIDAPAGIMSRLDVHVVGRSRKDEIITLNDESGNPEMIVCAVPFLREDDVIPAVNDEASEKSVRIREGIKSHYAEIFSRSLETRGDYDIPIIATGHIFLQSGKTQPDEGERSIYLGTAPNVGTDIFPEYIAYTALGHLHSPQRVGRANIRYSGSPLAMSFGELGATKTVSIVDFDGKNFAGIREIDIPVWQKMTRIFGDMAGIESEIRKLIALNESVWAEVTYTGNTQPVNLHERLAEMVRDSAVEVLSIIDDGKYKVHNTTDEFDGKTLDAIDPLKMFEHLMKAEGTPEEKQEKMKELYMKILQEVRAEEK